MKTLLALTLAATVSLHAAESALTPDGSRYSVEPAAESPHLVLVRVSGDVRDSFAVPATDDDAVESQPHVAYDATSGALYVVWTRQYEGMHELRYAIRAADGTWSAPHTVTSGVERILGTQVVVTHSVEDETTSASLLHFAWWKVGQTASEPWYAVAAIEKDQPPATAFASLVELAALAADTEAASELEDTGAAAHPPLAMARNGQDVDVVFGAVRDTTVTTLTIAPRRLDPNARIFVPVGRSGRRSPRAQFVSPTAEPLQAFISRNGRIVLYAPGERFSYVVLDSGLWTPARSLKVDEKLTGELVLKDLQRTVEELETLTLPHADR